MVQETASPFKRVKTTTTTITTTTTTASQLLPASTLTLGVHAPRDMSGYRTPRRPSLPCPPRRWRLSGGSSLVLAPPLRPVHAPATSPHQSPVRHSVKTFPDTSMY
ncbi:hypothetical protein O3P69_006352 [Scylla paramamosain]|uniref:Uncharacterized protein n=1 Tax=Scylla paramamosain TaxID=85552 RepID=A0AAW0U1Z2_SCYPA